MNSLGTANARQRHLSFQKRSQGLLPQSEQNPWREQNRRDSVTPHGTQNKDNVLRQSEYQPPNGMIIGQKTAQHPHGRHDSKDAVVGKIDQQCHDHAPHHTKDHILKKNHGMAQGPLRNMPPSVRHVQTGHGTAQKGQRHFIQPLCSAGGIANAEQHASDAKDIPQNTQPAPADNAP